MAKNLFIGNLSYGTSEAKLRDAFSKYGASQVRIMDGRGFGFVEVSDDQAATAISYGATGFICNDKIFRKVKEFESLIINDCV